VLYAVILASEIAFWALLVGGLYVRYALGRSHLSVALLLAAASTDLVVLAVAAADLAGGATAQTSHLIAAVAVAYSVVYAKHLVGIADRFVLRRLGREVAERPKASRAKREREGWYRHARMWAVGLALLGAGYAIAGDEGEALLAGAAIWTVVLAIDVVVSFSSSMGSDREVHEPGH
jgi:hypothetical protein